MLFRFFLFIGMVQAFNLFLGLVVTSGYINVNINHFVCTCAEHTKALPNSALCIHGNGYKMLFEKREDIPMW